jgi:CubicO group peptidase (beta-lactamase class C family)
MKKALVFPFSLLIIINLIIVISGNTYLYKTIIFTNPDVDDYKIFDNREIKTGLAQAWPLSKKYNKKDLPDSLHFALTKYESTAFLIIQNDSILYEQYWDDYDSSTLSGSFSVAKTIVGILIGIAIDEGKIKSIDERAGIYLPEFNEGGNAKLTIKHLLMMSAELDWDESYNSPFASTTKTYYGNEIAKPVLKLKVKSDPGKRFYYQSCNTEILALILEKASSKTLSDYAGEKLWQPMGAEHTALWSLDHKDGHEKAYCCFNSTARDFARIGQLFLKKGNWKGKQLISEHYVKESISPAPILNEDCSNSCDFYGYHWWLAKRNGKEIFYARGILGQYVIVIPEKNIVMVRLGNKRGDKPKGDVHTADFYTYINLVSDYI